MVGTKGIPQRAVAILLLASAIGVAGGLLGSGFHHGLRALQAFFVGSGDLPEAVGQLAGWETVLVPTLGGVLAGSILLLVRRGAPFGISDIIGLVALRKGTIRLRESLLQILSSACTIASGGSIGKEGANSQLAATVAAQFSRTLRERLGSRERSVLLGCGVAAGMATSYNAPIAGAIFVMEAVLGNFAMDVFAPVVLASVVATMVRRELIAEQALYDLGGESFRLDPNLVLAALLLGIICGVGGILFRAALWHGRRAFQLLRLPAPAALGLGGLVVGLIGLHQPLAWGNGFETIREIVISPDRAPGLIVVLTLFLWKVVATVATVGSGGLGGIFTPNLVVGAAFGAFFAYAVAALPGGGGVVEPRESTAFAFVGMAGLCAATTHAPVTAVVLVFELTAHYEMVPPIMLCSLTASVVARTIDRDNFYTQALRAKGEELPAGIEELAIRTTYVRDVMRRDARTVGHTAGFDDVMELLANTRGDTLYVLDDGGGLVGRIQLQDVKNFINDPTLSSVVIAGDLTRPSVTVSRDDSLARVLPLFDDPELGEIAVVDGDRRLLGRVRQQDVIAGIRSEVLDQQQRRARFRDERGQQRHSEALPAEWELATLDVPGEWNGLTVDSLPEDLSGWLVPVLVIRRDDEGERRLAATPGLVLQEGWRLLALCRSTDLKRWRSARTGS